MCALVTGVQTCALPIYTGAVQRFAKSVPRCFTAAPETMEPHPQGTTKDTKRHEGTSGASAGSSFVLVRALRGETSPEASHPRGVVQARRATFREKCCTVFPGDPPPTGQIVRASCRARGA